MAKWNSAEAQYFIERLNTDEIASFLRKINVLDIDQVAASDINDRKCRMFFHLIDAAKEAGFIKENLF